MTDDQLLAAFLDQTFPHAEWNHRAHVKVAYLFASQQEPATAVESMRSGVQAYNAANQIPEALDQGYHDTLTVAFMRLIIAAVQDGGPFASADDFCERHPELLNRHALRKYYSHKRMMTWDAKRSFVEPDLAELPTIDRGAGL